MTMAPEKPALAAKIMLLGAVGAGKSSLVNRFARDRFDADYKTTIGVDVQTCDIQAESGAMVRLMLWDTDGDFGQRIFETAYVKGASGAIIVADASRPATLEKMKGLLEAFSERMPGRALRAVVNKSDLATVAPEELRAAGLFPDEMLFTSAKTGAGVRELFASIAGEIARRA